MKIDTNAEPAGRRLQAAAVAMRAELERETTLQASRIEAEMKRRAPKGQRSTLANSVRDQRVNRFEHFIGPHVDYAGAVEEGRKPGRGLPWFGTLEARGAMAWLEARMRETAAAFNPRHRRAGRKGSARYEADALDLRVRYFYWSAAVKRRGIPAQPFVKPTAEAFRGVVPDALQAALRRGLAGLGGGGTA